LTLGGVYVANKMSSLQRGAGEITVTYIVQTAALFATLYAAIILMRFA
jgi:hypothetical protein